MINSFSMTDIGKSRQLNQDFVFSSNVAVGKLPNIFIVADGMGGHKAGDFASKCAAETFVEDAQKNPNDNVEVIFERGIRRANAVVRSKAMEDPELRGMGTTMVVASCIDNLLKVANVGDSRLYVLSGEDLQQITTDHSLVEEMVRMGGLERSQARLHPKKNIITKAVGVEEAVEPDFFEVQLRLGDMVLMCSDGLSNMLDDSAICSILTKEGDLQSKAQKLIDAANDNGGKDNIAVILIQLV